MEGMVSSEFNHAAEHLGKRIHDLDQTLEAEGSPQPPEGKPLAVTTRETSDELLRITVTDGLVNELYVDGQFLQEAHPTAVLRRITAVLNEALEANQTEQLEAMKQISPSLTAVEAMVRESSAEFLSAYQNLLGKL